MPNLKTTEVDQLEHLGSAETSYPTSGPSHHILESFDNPRPGRNYTINLDFPEFTSHCPKTGQPDFATMSVKYVPGLKCVETKSLKLYYFAWRSEGAFMENIVNTILDDLVEAINPDYMVVTGSFNARGGIPVKPVAIHVSPDFDMAAYRLTL